MKRRRIAVVTGSRAEYGLLYWVLKEIQADPELELQIIVTGMHLSPEFGSTWKLIEKDGFSIDARVEMLLSSDTPTGIAKSVGLGVIGFADALDRLRPDILLLLGDRFEILSAAQAAMIARIPIAHIHGGEATEGLIDEAIRHSVTKMSQIHFTAAEPYRQRVIRMGENPDMVFNLGAPGLDNILRLSLMGKEELEDAIGLKITPPSFLVTYHPVTLASSGPSDAFQFLLDALSRFPDSTMIFTMPNADAGGRAIAEMMHDYASKRSEKVALFTSLGQKKYLSAMSMVDVVVGNSSSGIIEAPLFRKPTVDIGSRQSGRLKAQSVIGCDEDSESIITAINKALSVEFRNTLKETESMYGAGNASARIVQQLKTIELEGILFKRFYELEQPR